MLSRDRLNGASDTLTRIFENAIACWPNQVALEEPPDGSITYRELGGLVESTAVYLRGLGVQPGDRVGICLPKTIDAVAAILSVLEVGAAYVPVDPSAPASRNAYILNDCSVRIAFVDTAVSEVLAAELAKLGAVPPLVRLANVGGGRGLAALPANESEQRPILQSAAAPSADDLAYILYTSGSTGKPKGVMLSHRNATSFVDWCSATFEPTSEDRFSSHAPLHFDLSILDLYVPIAHGATVVLIGAEAGKEPVGLAQLISSRRISVWYSTPSILSALAQYGRLERQAYPALRTVLFAGEVFPIKHLRSLRRQWPHPRYYNLYGPTETNVCTFYEVPAHVPDTRVEPYPIGKVCSHLQARVVDENGNEVAPGAEGELVISGPGVMQGYWHLPENTARAFLEFDGQRWYRTGDLVAEDDNADFQFVGRRDRMVKRRGYRIELGEIEAGLYRHPSVLEVAVIAVAAGDGGVRIVACLSCKNGQQPSVIELKRFSAEALPLYMVPDVFVVHDALPKTSTDKIDYQRLVASL